MIKRILIVLATILAIIFVPYYLGMINLGLIIDIPRYLVGIFYIVIIFSTIIIIIIIIINEVLIPIYEYIKYGN